MPKMSIWKRFPKINDYLVSLFEEHPQWKVEKFIETLKVYCGEQKIPTQFIKEITTKAVKQRLNYIQDKVKDDDALFKKTIKTERELTKVKSERDWYRTKQKYLEQNQILQEMVIEEIRKTVEAAPPVAVPKTVISKDKDITNESAVMMLSDIHYDEIIKLEETQGLGFNNKFISARRIQQLVDSVIRITTKQFRQAYNLKALHIFGLGDWVSGTIHEELLRTGQSNIINQSYGLAYILYQAILELAQIFPLVKVHIIGGNHPRLEKKPYFKEKYVNWDTVVGYTLATMLRRQKNVIFNIPLSIIDSVEIENHIFLIMHGDSVRSYGIMPYYGLQRAASQVELIKGGQFKENFRKIKEQIEEIGKNFDVNNLEKLTRDNLEDYAKEADKIFKEIIRNSDQLIDKICMGHFHDASTLLNGKILINGSVVGPNEYALAKFMGNRPMQRFFGIHREKGMSWEFSLRLDLADKDLENLRYKIYDSEKQYPEQIALL